MANNGQEVPAQQAAQPIGGAAAGRADERREAGQGVDARPPPDMATVVNRLADAIDNFRNDRVPPPPILTGKGGLTELNSFFPNFERYCRALYKDDVRSWLLILPSFTSGEPREMVMSFGAGVEMDYGTVKQRLILEFTSRNALGTNVITDFFAAVRRPGESLACYSIRLLAMSKKVSVQGFPAHSIDLMIKSKFVYSLPPTMIEDINVTLGHLDDVSFDQIVKLATILENRARNQMLLASPAGAAAQAAAVPTTNLLGAGFSAPSSFQSATTAYGQPAAAGLGGVQTPAGPVAAYGQPAAACGTPYGMASGGTGLVGLQQAVHAMPQYNIASLTCAACGRNGHTEADCYSRQGTCYRCGQPGHFARSCPSKNNYQSNKAGTSKPTGSSNSSSLPNCLFCGMGKHYMSECGLFKQRCMACSWCGSADHESYQCSKKPQGN